MAPLGCHIGTQSNGRHTGNMVKRRNTQCDHRLSVWIYCSAYDKARIDVGSVAKLSSKHVHYIWYASCRCPNQKVKMHEADKFRRVVRTIKENCTLRANEHSTCCMEHCLAFQTLQRLRITFSAAHCCRKWTDPSCNSQNYKFIHYVPNTLPLSR